LSHQDSYQKHNCVTSTAWVTVLAFVLLSSSCPGSLGWQAVRVWPRSGAAAFPKPFFLQYSLGYGATQPACLPAYLPPSLPAYLPTTQPACLPTYHPACLPAYHPACLPTTQPACLPPSLPAYHPACLPTTQPACQEVKCLCHR
jgi:hypothetical protein